MAADLHLEPPLTPRGVLLRHPALVGGVAAVAVTLALLATFSEGVLLSIDEPVQRWVEAHRTPGLGRIFRGFSSLGSNVVVFAVFAVLVAWVSRRCKALALTLTAAVMARPVLELVIKELVDRDRPDLDRLVPGTGPSMPSGHVLAAVALWGLLPPVAAAFSPRRALWWATVVVGTVFITGIAMSRVYLGVHWLTDVVEGFALGALYLVALEELFAHHHRRRGCPLVDRSPDPSTGGDRAARRADPAADLSSNPA